MLSLEQAKLKNPFRRNHLIRDALSKALYDAMRDDPAVHLFGEGCEAKMHYDAPEIERDFADRIHTMPISEDGNVNFAVGTSLLGVKPVVDIISADFLYRCFDSIANTAAKLDFVTGQPHTIVIRAEFLLGGPTTGQRPEALFAHIPGIRIAIPSDPYTAYGLMRDALETPGVTILFEDRMIEDEKFDLYDMQIAGRPVIGLASWRVMGKRGNGVILTYGVMRQVVEDVLRPYQDLKGDSYDDGYDMLWDVVDLHSLTEIPFDWLHSHIISRSGKVLIVEPDITYGGIGAEIAAKIIEREPHVRVKRLGAPKQAIPASPSMHGHLLPSEADIVNAIRSF